MSQMNRDVQLLENARQAVEEEKFEKAAELLDQILKDDPQNDEAWMLATKIIHDPDKRREYLSNAIISNPNNAQAVEELKQLSYAKIDIPPKNSPSKPNKKSLRPLRVGFLMGGGGILIVIFLCDLAIFLLSTDQPDFISTPIACDYEVETAIVNQQQEVQNRHDGFSGIGYLQFPEEAPQTSHIEWKVHKDFAGRYTLKIKYANGDQNNRYLQLIINNENGQLTHPLLFPTTHSWSNWNVLEHKIFLDAGENTIQLRTVRGSNAPILDCIAVETD